MTNGDRAMPPQMKTEVKTETPVAVPVRSHAVMTTVRSQPVMATHSALRATVPP